MVTPKVGSSDYDFLDIQIPKLGSSYYDFLDIQIAYLISLKKYLAYQHENDH